MNQSFTTGHRIAHLLAGAILTYASCTSAQIIATVQGVEYSEKLKRATLAKGSHDHHGSGGTVIETREKGQFTVEATLPLTAIDFTNITKNTNYVIRIVSGIEGLFQFNEQHPFSTDDKPFNLKNEITIVTSTGDEEGTRKVKIISWIDPINKEIRFKIKGRHTARATSPTPISSTSNFADLWVNQPSGNGIGVGRVELHLLDSAFTVIGSAPLAYTSSIITGPVNPATGLPKLSMVSIVGGGGQ